jgi:hypothetical protein
MTKVIVKNRKPGNGFKDLTGQRFGRLIVVEYLGSEVVQTIPVKKYKSVFKVICDCGNEKIVRGADLGEKTVSCGCYSRQKTIEFNIKTKTKESYNAFSSVWMSYRHGAKKRGYNFEISRDEFLKICKMNCHYCGDSPNMKRKSRTKGKVPEFLYNGVDRVDNEIGYILENVVPCCSFCNRIKLDRKLEDFVNQVKKIHSHLNL